MNQFKQLLFAIIIGCTSFQTIGQQSDNTKPMYGEVPKSDEYKKIDEAFKTDCLVQFGTIDSSVNVYIDFAWRYFYNNDLKTAMKRFNQAWLLNAEFPDSYFGFAALMEVQGNKPEAERFYKMGLEKDTAKKRAVMCYQRIADCKEHLQDFNGTIDAYTKISELDSSNVFAFKKLGYLLTEMHKLDEALIAYGKAIELDSSDAMTYNIRGNLYLVYKNYSKAINDLTKAIELDPNNLNAYVNRGISELAIHHFASAKKDFEQCVRLDPEAGELWRLLGEAKVGLHDASGACRDFAKAKRLGDEMVEGLIERNCY
ncbi:MAG: hypothetical protein RLZ33_1999 [Bacteroidota bacterium]|jgi:tetratricopeptide (TPR) repeat protein